MARFTIPKAALTVLAATAISLGMFGAQKVAAAVQDCTNNSIIYCGSTTPTDFVSKVKANNPADLQAIYANFGLVPAEYQKFATSARMGTAYQDGRIVVDGQTVATGAWSIGRTGGHSYNRAMNISGKTYYASNSTDVFRSASIPVMAMFDGKGVMQFAVLTACGNPITGNKTTPSYSCDLLNKTAVAGQDNTYSFTTKASAAMGATIAKVTYDFGDNSATVTTTSLSTPVNHTYAKPGNYTAKVTVTVNLPGNQAATVTSATCSTPITVQAPPKTPEVCATNVNLPKDSPKCTVCQYNASLPADSQLCAPCQYNSAYPANSPACKAPEAPVTPTTPTTPTTPATPTATPPSTPAAALPNTGAGSVIAIAAAVSVVSAIGYRIFLGRRLSRQS